ISPVGLTGHTGVKLNETMVLITGGVNEHIFDKYFIDIAAAAALWSLIQQSEIQFAQGFLQAAWETQERAFQLIKEQHLEQLPM
ncbi:hypothetical protein MJM43_33325, partial [Salmonella enterica subsp. enterica serovar Montevideo]|nr:hypothetical protein [Salmonella enterica subsp. enterica serovar Montevideo]